jgi:hypothetical protein
MGLTRSKWGRFQTMPLRDSSVMPWSLLALDMHVNTTNLDSSYMLHNSHVLTDGTRIDWPGCSGPKNISNAADTCDVDSKITIKKRPRPRDKH